MKYPRFLLFGATALGAALIVSSASFAQEPPAGAPPAPGAMREQWAQHMQQRAEARAHALHDILHVRPDQEGAFQAFVASMRPPERQGGPGRAMDHQSPTELTTPERLDRMAARMAKRQAEFQRKADAVRRFYAALDPEQKRAFDALHGLMGGGGRHGPGGHHGLAEGGGAHGAS